jgi:hypothetical protein
MRLRIPPQHRVIEWVARRVRARMGVDIDQTRQKPTTSHDRLGARDLLARNTIPGDPEISYLVVRKEDAA